MPSRLPPEILPGNTSRSRGTISRRPMEQDSNRLIRPPGSRGLDGSASRRGALEQFRSNRGLNPTVPDVRSAIGSRSGRSREFLPPPPPPPISNRLTNRYWRYATRHFDNYSDYWFGGAPSWHSFVHTISPAPWFWNDYYYVHTWPWVFGYYDPVAYVNWGWWTPRWYGRVFYPWWDWCDAPFVYFYYSYPARFSISLNVGSAGFYYDDYYNDYYDSIDYDYDYGDIYNGGASIVVAAVDRPLGVWVPGHWEPRYVVDTDWIWVPGHYVY